jgi:hypothetical protein
MNFSYHDLTIFPNLRRFNLLNGLLAYWHFSGAKHPFIDRISGFQLTGDFQETITSNTNPVPNLGSYSIYSGNKASLAYSSPYFELTGDMSFQTWAYPTGDIGQEEIIFGKTNSQFVTSYCFLYFPSGIYYRVGNNLIGGQTTDINAGIPSLNTWYHLVGTYSKSGGASPTQDVYTLYINGTGAASGAKNTPNTTGAFGISVGNHFSTNNNNGSFRGNIDSSAIWNRTLSKEEVSILYNAGSGLEYPFS